MAFNAINVLPTAALKMNYAELPPSKPLAGLIKRFWSLEYDSAFVAQPETVLPDGCPEIVFNLSDRFLHVTGDGDELQPSTVFSGQLSRNITIRPTGRVRLFGVRFQPAGAGPFGIAMSELTDQVVELQLVLGNDAGALEERINLAFDFDDRVRIFESWIRSRLANEIRDDIAIVAAEMILRSGGTMSLRALRNSLGISERRLERRFMKDVGCSPKMLARISRFQNVVRNIQSADKPDFADIALSSGYYDQSHMIREFSEFSGETPLGYLKRTHDISDAFTAVA